MGIHIFHGAFSFLAFLTLSSRRGQECFIGPPALAPPVLVCPFSPSTAEALTAVEGDDDNLGT